jgi:hypothetical protein
LGLGLVLLLGVPFVMTLLAASIVGIPLMLIELCPNLVFEHLKESGVSG